MAAPKQGGFKMSLAGLKGKVGLKAGAMRTDVKKPRLAILGDDEPDDTNKHQEISGWDAAEGGAIGAAGKKEKEAPRVIPTLPNRKWGEEARRKQLVNAPHVQAQNAVPDVNMQQEPEMKFGLTILKKEEPQENGAEAVAAPSEPMEDIQKNLTQEQRHEKKALDALLSGKTDDEARIIPVRTEEEALRDDVSRAPEAPTLAAYEATPIEGFGAALLRGMGWKDGQAIGKNGAISKPKVFKRRPALLGIGAKADAAPGVELGEWVGSKGKGKGKAAPQSYTPLTLRNKVTGELITEEELKAKMEQQKLVKDEKPAKERRKYDDEDNGRRREKRRDARDNCDRRRDGDHSKRDRDRYDDRKRDRDDNHYDSERRREKQKDKYREDDYHDSERRSEKRKDRSRRDRSRSPDDDRRGKRRDRYRSRSRDPEDGRKRRRDCDYEYEDDCKRSYRDRKNYR